MTASYVRAAWLTAEDGGEGIAAYADALAAHGGAGTCAYVLAPKTPVMTDIKRRLASMDEQRYRTMPTHLVLTAIDTLDGGLTLEADLPGAPPGVAVVVSGLYCELTRVAGTLGDPPGSFAPAVQLGTFSMRSAADEWAVSEWYRTRRLPSFSGIEGGYRARRLVSACGGPGKLGVLYEFRSLQDRALHFEPLETVDHDEQRPSAAARTVHPPMSPSVGALLPR